MKSSTIIILTVIIGVLMIGAVGYAVFHEEKIPPVNGWTGFYFSQAVKSNNEIGNLSDATNKSQLNEFPTYDACLQWGVDLHDAQDNRLGAPDDLLYCAPGCAVSADIGRTICDDAHAHINALHVK